MLGNYEKRRFSGGEKVWLGHYRNLTNVLHWHFECELIRIVEGRAQIKIGGSCYDGVKGESFFCSGEELHYIISEPESQVDVMILDRSIAGDVADKYSLVSPRLPEELPVAEYFGRVGSELEGKGRFYRETAENHARGLVLEIFSRCEIRRREDSSLMFKNLISKINEEFAFISFEDAAAYSGYSPSHFSKMFKRLSGMTFSEYLNIIRVENAIMLMRSSGLSMTDISLKCGFATVRNFNRVFRQITGSSPRALPEDYIIDTGLRVARDDDFDPTGEESVLI